MLDLHTIAHTRAGTILFLALDTAATIDTTNDIGNGCSIQQLALVFAIVLACLIVVLLFFFFFGVLAVVIAHVVIALDETLSLALATPQVAMLFLLAVRQHDHIPLEFSIFLNRFQEIIKGDFKFGEYVLLQVIFG
uniref:Uncharacterized protein n=1 Tax=Favella ehrenbergii TaxID=182087 RepID=A0A7S3I9K1_9SPIT|mmetsp:Transcript_9908/g.12301  ORF Transcript_9908/g.12301 Transcript_9908/m.12301 type:complete len:136 (+) Transcript_9908:202-609(+)